MTTIIDSKNGQARAYLKQVADGVEVAIWHREKKDGQWCRIARDVIKDKPMHVVLDHMHRVIDGQ